MNILTGMLMFTIEDGPKYWFVRGKVNKTLETIVLIYNKNCKFETKDSSLGNGRIQEEETSQYLYSDDTTNKKKQMVKIELNEKKNCIKTLSKELGLDEYDLTKFDITIKMLDNLEHPNKKLTPFKLLFSKSYRWVFFGVISIFTARYSLFYSTTFDASTLNFGSTNINMIFFAVPQT